MNTTQQRMALWSIIIIITSISGVLPMWPSWMHQHQSAKQYSNMFKNLQGSNRLNEFSHLQTILDAAATNGYTKEDMIQIFGTPSKVTTTQLQYWLQEDDTKNRVTININETTKRVTGYGVIE